MKNLFELTELTRNDEEMIELKIKENSSEDLLELGFPGTETFIRLYRGNNDRRIEKINRKENQKRCFETSRQSKTQSMTIINFKQNNYGRNE